MSFTGPIWRARTGVLKDVLNDYKHHARAIHSLTGLLLVDGRKPDRQKEAFCAATKMRWKTTFNGEVFYSDGRTTTFVRLRNWSLTGTMVTGVGDCTLCL
jgi:hypothetical protein